MADFNSTYLSSNDIELLVQSPRDAVYIAPSSVTVAANIRYDQRVYDTGTAGWCYYSTLNMLDPAPSSGSTAPPWTGSISNPQVVAAVEVP